MNSHQQELRQAATHQFLESLNELGRCATTAEPSQPSQPSAPTPRSRPAAPSANLDLAAWEDAVLDIEQFMQNR